MASDDLNKDLSKKTEVFGLMVWEVIGICVGLFIIIILCLLSLCLTSRKKSRKERNTIPISQIPAVSKEIKTIRVEKVLIQNDHSFTEDGLHENFSTKSRDSLEKTTGCESQLSGDEGSSISICTTVTNYKLCSSPMFDIPDYLGWGYWFTMRELDIATNFFSKENVIGEGGYGVVYKGCLLNGTPVAVKKILNNQGQAEQEFRVEVEAIGHVRHKNLVRLLGYCIEGIHRMLVYEYVNNGNLELWLHGAVDQTHNEYLTWDSRIKILLGTAKGLAYLHEAIEPKVVHRDIKSSNILIDDDFNAKVSDFGLAKLLDAGKTHVTTRVMGTFGYVAPEYANTGLLNEKSDVYSFGVVILETITGRDPVDYERPAKEVNLIDWMKLMVGSRQFEELIDPNIRERPSTRALKRVLLVALRCVDQDYEKRPKMGQVVRMLESEKLYFTSRH